MSARRRAESAGIEPRGFLARHEAHRPFARFARSAMFERAGGRFGVDALIEGLYARIGRDPALRPLFERALTNERAATEALLHRLSRRRAFVHRARSGRRSRVDTSSSP